MRTSCNKKSIETHPYFKKSDKAIGLISGNPEPDAHGNVLGPFPFLTEQNTKILQSTDDPPSKNGFNYGVEFAGDMKWYELGLKGLAYIKDVLGVPSVTYMVFGLGKAVEKELEKVAEDQQNYPSLNQLTIEVTRQRPAVDA